MPFPVLSQADLPKVGTSCERSEIDFKTSAVPKPSIEHAKDVAALANTLGGSIIVGAATSGTVVMSYPGLPMEIAARLPDAYEQSVKDRCRPAPRIASEVIPLDGGGSVVVVNVWAWPMAPVGVHVKQERGGDLVDQAWAFPVRVGSHTRYLQPDQFGTLENVSARRIAAMLLLIPVDEREKIQIRWTRPSGPHSSSPYAGHQFEAVLEDVLPDKNVARFRVGPQRSDALTPLHLPLDWIETVWHDQRSGMWVVASKAVIEAHPPGSTTYRAFRV